MSDEFKTGSSGDNVPAAIEQTRWEALCEWGGDFFAGIPKVYRKAMESSAVKLIGAGADLGVTKLRLMKTDMEQKQAEKDKFRKAMTKQAISVLPDRPDLAARAAENFFNDIFEKQERRENVVRFAAEELSHQQSPPEADATPPSEALDEDWLTGLQGFAEKASSERMQRLFGRILAGEIRRPGSFSLFTLDVVSKLSPQDAANIVKIAPFVVGDILMREPIVPPQIDYSLRTALSGIGVIDSASVALNVEFSHESEKYNFLQLQFPNKYISIFTSGDKRFLIISSEKSRSKLSGTGITATGMEILSLHVRDHDAGMLGRWAASLSAEKKELYISDYVALPDDCFRLKNIAKIEPAAG